MQTNLPISHGRSMPKPGHFVTSRMSYLIKTILICSCFLMLAISTNGQVLNANGQTHEISYNGSYQEFTIPDAANLNGNNFITFFAKGADGGKRKVRTLIGKAGGGAKATGTFEIGTSIGDLKPGGRIRFIVGEKGNNDTSTRSSGAGGGGGSGIIYTEAASDNDITCSTVSTNFLDAATCWVVLVVGGGGGGAYGSTFGSLSGGKSGRDNESGGDGNGTNPGNGGIDGNGGASVNAGSTIDRAGGGGGAKSDGTNDFSNTAGGAGQFEGGDAGNAGSLNRRGGFGYGGGGSGATLGVSSRAGGGGGGGYSGGGGGDNESGGGGGSFVNPSAVLIEKENGNRDSSPDNGRITYKFEEEVTAVIAKCKDLEVTLVNGTYTIVPNDLENGSIVEPGESISLQVIDPFSFSRTFTCADIGEQLLTYIIISTSGATDDCTAVVEVLDGNSPSLTCPTNPITAMVTQAQDYTISPNNLGISASDDCSGPVELSVFKEVFTCTDLGMQTITVFGEDESANIGSCDVTFNVTADSETASINCPADVTIGLGDANNCPAQVIANQLEPIVEGSCASELTYQIVNADGDVFASGIGVLGDTEFPMPTNVVTYTFGANNLATPLSCSFTVSLQGDFSDDILLECQDNLTFDLNADDNCAIFLNEALIIPFYYACFESVEGNLTYTDINGQVTTTPPFDGFSPGGLNFGVGVSEVSFTGRYGSLSETCSFTVTVNDVTPPVAQCKDLTVTLAPDECSVSIPFSDFDNGSTDDCSGENLEFLIPEFTDCNAGPCVNHPPSYSASISGAGIHTVAFSVRDQSGNISPCTQTITLIDETPPSVVCQDVSINLDASGAGQLGANGIDDGSSDNCNIASTSWTPMSFDCTDVGTVSVTQTFTDASGNSTSCTQIVTVNDFVAPVALCNNFTTQLGASGNASITVDDIDGGSTDACGLDSRTLNQNGFTCNDVGNQTVTLTITDPSGNSSSCDATITVEDNIMPTALCKDINLPLSNIGQASITAEDIDNGSSDVCNLLPSIVNPSTFDCTDVGPNTVMLTITDIGGNTATCTSTVTVIDDIAPNVQCQDIIVVLNANGQGTASVDDAFDTHSFDACGPLSISFDPESTLTDLAFDCSNIGDNPSTVYVTDANGNSSAPCNINIDVQDNTVPVASCQNLTVLLDATGTATITAQQIDNGSSDACGIDQLTLNQNFFDCDDEGMKTITLTVEDVYGNQSNCNAVVTVAIGGALPSGWNSSDIGMVSMGNDYAFEPCGVNSGQFYITGSGNNAISSTTDNVAYAYQNLCGDGSIIAKIESIDPNGYGGLMIRETIDAGSKQVSIYSNQTNFIRHETRYTTNNIKQVNNFFKPSPTWLKLERQGNWIFAYYSTTGSFFQYIHAVFVPMQSCVEIGLVSFTNFPFAQTETIFSNVSVTGNNGTLGASLSRTLNPESRTLNLEPFNLYPNPASDELMVQLSLPFEEQKTITLYNAFGQQVATRILMTGQQTMVWDVNALPVGTYWMKIEGGNSVYKVVISR